MVLRLGLELKKEKSKTIRLMRGFCVCIFLMKWFLLWNGMIQLSNTPSNYANNTSVCAIQENQFWQLEMLLSNMIRIRASWILTGTLRMSYSNNLQFMGYSNIKFTPAETPYLNVILITYRRSVQEWHYYVLSVA